MPLNRETPVPLYFQLIGELREKLLKKLDPGAMIPSERELCERFRVSRITVRKAIEELTVNGELYKLHGKGTFKTRNTASSIRELTYVIYDIGMAAYPGRERSIQAMAEVAEKRGYHFVIRGFNTSAGKTGFRDFAFRDVNGGYIISVQELTPEDIAEIRRKRIPCVFMNQSEGYSVRASLADAGVLAAKWVNRQKIRRIALLVPPLALPDNRDSLDGFQKTLAGRHQTEIREVPYDRRKSSAALQQLLNDGFIPEAVVCADDLIAAGAADVLDRKKLRGKVSLCGLNNTYLAAELNFSSVDLHTDQRSRTAAELLADILEGKAPPPPYSIFIKPEFIERKQK